MPKVKTEVMSVTLLGSILNCESPANTKTSLINEYKKSAKYIKSTINTGLKNIVMPVIKKFIILSTLFVVSANATTNGEI